MSGRRLSVGVFILSLIFGILSSEADARTRFRRGSAFGRSTGRFSSFSPAFRFSSRQFPRRNIFRPPVFTPIVFPENPSIPSQPVNPGLPIHGDPSVPGTPDPGRRVRPIDPNPLPRIPEEFYDDLVDGPSCVDAELRDCRTLRQLFSRCDSQTYPNVAACQQANSATNPSFPKELGRVKGGVVRHTGDFQPPTNEPGRGVLTVTPIPNGRVFVFKGELAQKRDGDGFTIPRAIDTLGKTPIRIVRADGDGKFQVDLPPGTYTIVAEINGELRHTDGGGPVYPNRNWSTITISQGREREYSIVDDQTTH